jgi:hypothetical protein
VHDSRFDALTRTASTRRFALAGLFGGVTSLLGLPGPKQANAHDLAPRCRKLKDAKRRRACLRRARAHARTHRCKRQPPATVCASVRRCDGLAVDNCGKLVNCTCPVGKVCTDNGSCVQRCSGCPAGCFCGTDVEGGIACFMETQCAQIPQVCGSSATCLPGFRCIESGCGSGSENKRCVPVCAG